MPASAAARLKGFHAFQDSVRWRVTPRGVAVEGKGVERTPGVPGDRTRVWDLYHDQINAAATRFGVPAQLIVATICTESSGRADAIRLEPRFVSDAATPDQVSPGLMQTLISTARAALNNPNIDRKWLFVPGNSIMAGTAYIASQAGVDVARSAARRRGATTPAASATTRARRTAGSSSSTRSAARSIATASSSGSTTRASRSRGIRSRRRSASSG